LGSLKPGQDNDQDHDGNAVSGFSGDGDALLNPIGGLIAKEINFTNRSAQDEIAHYQTRYSAGGFILMGSWAIVHPRTPRALIEIFELSPGNAPSQSFLVRPWRMGRESTLLSPRGVLHHPIGSLGFCFQYARSFFFDIVGKLDRAGRPTVAPVHVRINV
jgi:hypothetical protein